MSLLRTVLITAILFVEMSISAQPELKFFRYSQNDGLVNNDVLTICQDSLGFIWFGTKRGCSRFEGVEFKNFKANDNIDKVIRKGWIKKIISDNKGRLWFVSPDKKNSIFKFNFSTEDFENYNAFISSGGFNENQRFHAIFQDKSGKLWLGTEYGPIVFDPDNLDVHYFKEFFGDTPLFKSKGVIRIKDFIEDNNSNIWIATNIGLFVYHRAKDTFIHFKHEKHNNNSLSSSICICFYNDVDNNIWIGTHNGLNKAITTNTHELPIAFERFYHNPADENSLPDNLIYDIDADNDNNLLIATVHGLCLLEAKTGRIFRYFHNEFNAESINSNIVRAIYKDKSKNIWLATSHGACKLKSRNFIKTYSYSNTTNSLSHNKVLNFCELSTSEVWIATPKGIDVFNCKTNHFALFLKENKKNNGLPGSPIFLYPDDQKIWIGTYRGGVSVYNKKSKSISNFKLNKDPSLLKTVQAMLRDSKGNLWINDLGINLFVYKKDNNEMIKLPQIDGDIQTLSSYLVTSIMEDSDSNIWVATNNGLNKVIDFENGICERYLHGKVINHIIEGYDKKMWAATEDGLYLLNKKTKKLTLVREQNDLTGEIYSMVEDVSCNLWISSNKGISRLSQNGDTSFQIMTFRKEDGLPIIDFLPNSCLRLSDGAILFGSSQGFCKFHPSHISYDTISPIVVFTNLKINQKTIKPGQVINGQVVLDQSISKTNKIVLNNNNNDFIIEFAGLYSNIPQNNQYYYRLQNSDTDNPEWIITTAQKREAKYMNLPQGEYEFQVKCKNGHGIISSKIAVLNISILPPWWQTLWFRISLAVFIVITFFIVLRLRTYSLQKQKQKLGQLVTERTYELQDMNTQLEERQMEFEQQARQMADMNKSLLGANSNLEIKTREVESMASKVHEADQKQLRFFANISHEFRTPLTLIVGTLEKYTKRSSLPQPDEWPQMFNYLQLAHRNAKRLTQLVNQILDFRKLSQKETKINLSSNNIIEFISEIVKAFSVMAEAKDIHLSFSIEHLSKNIYHLSLNKNHMPSTIESQPQQDKQFKTENTSNKDDQMSNDKCNMINDFWFDPDIMEKILFNLISNALKYTPKGGEILIALDVVDVETRCIASLQNNQLAIKISDTGIGIKPKNVDNIFDRFYRVKTRLIASQPEGTGIGLAFTKEMVKRLQGDIPLKANMVKAQHSLFNFPFYWLKISLKQMNRIHLL